MDSTIQSTWRGGSHGLGYRPSRGAEPDEVAHVIAYLAGEQARPITGTVLAVDAGRVCAL